MTSKTIQNLPNVNSINCDILDMHNDIQDQYDIINMAYTVQFIKQKDLKALWIIVYRLLKPGGLIILSGKVSIPGRSSQFFNDQYVKFREENGYTREEIEAKTKALRGSMHVETSQCTSAYMSRVGFIDYQEVCRWLQFSTVIAFKRG